MAILLNLCKDYSSLRHCRNCNLTAESPQISTRGPQTPDKATGTLCAKCAKLKKIIWFCVPEVSVVSFHGQDRREPNMCVRDFPREKLLGTPSGKGLYLTVNPSSCPNMNLKKTFSQSHTNSTRMCLQCL